MASPTRDLESAPVATSRAITLAPNITPSADDPIKQWQNSLNVVIAANRFIELQRSRVAAAPFDQNALQQDREEDTSDHEEGITSNSPLAHISSPVVQANDQQHDLRDLRIVQGGLVKQLNVFGIVLTLLATVMSVAILQPPGSFDAHGHIRPSALVACYLLFASLSFLLACTGLFAVIVGHASLYRPRFYLAEAPVTAGLDSTSTLVKIAIDNLLRVKRLKTYLGFSLAMGMTAYVCGAFAILGPGSRNLWMAVGTVAVSTVILVTEAVITWTGPALPDNTLKRLQQIIY